MSTPTADDLLAQAKELSAGTLLERLGIKVTEWTLDQVVATMPVAGNTQPYGLLHGGASLALAETLGSLGSALHAGVGRVAIGVEINATHHRAARNGLVTGVARPIRLGRTLCTWEVQVTDENQQLLCTSRITCLLRDSAPGHTQGP